MQRDNDTSVTCRMTSATVQLVSFIVAVIPMVVNAQYADLPSCSRESQAQALAATVRIRNSDGSCGSGFIVYQSSKYVYIVTANHVVSPQQHWTQVDRFSIAEDWPLVKEVFNAQAIAANETTDLAVLRCDASGIQQPVLQVARTYGDLPFDGFSVGCGGCRPAEVSARRVESLNLFMSHNSRLIAVSPFAEGGQSGGPLLDRHGEVTGVCVLNAENKAWFSSLNAMHEVLDEAGLTHCYAPSAPPRFLTTLLIVGKLVAGIVVFIIIGQQ